MTQLQADIIAAQLERYKDKLQLKVCVSYDVNPGHDPYPEWFWNGDGWYESAKIVAVHKNDDETQVDVLLIGGGYAKNYSPEDIEIPDWQVSSFPELFDYPA